MLYEMERKLWLIIIYFGVILICFHGFKALIYSFSFFLSSFFLLKIVVLIYYGSKLNGIKRLAVKLWAVVRQGSLLADHPRFSPFVLVGEYFVASSSGSACPSHLVTWEVLGYCVGSLF